MKTVGTGLALAVLALVLLPDLAHAWTPGTHIYLGEAVLANLAQLPAGVAELLRAFPFDFLYGSIAADTSMAKKYAPVGRHCHAWHVGDEIYDLADRDPLRAFGLGYLAHLAADVVAHNYFVPRQLVLTPAGSLGHSYWESRFETHLGDAYARTARELILMDHSDSDAHLDRIISPTIFSVKTNRRLFRGMVHLTDTTSWQRAFQIVSERSRWDLANADVARHMAFSYQFIVETLGGDGGGARVADPSGEALLKRATRLRRKVRREVGGPSAPEQLVDVAEEHFSLPHRSLPAWDDSVGQRPWETTPPASDATIPGPLADPPDPATPS